MWLPFGQKSHAKRREHGEVGGKYQNGKSLEKGRIIWMIGAHGKFLNRVSQFFFLNDYVNIISSLIRENESPELWSKKYLEKSIDAGFDTETADT